MQASLSMGGPFPVEKNLESGGGSYIGDFEGGMEGSFTGDPERYVK
jgi:hypothetical protein